MKSFIASSACSSSLVRKTSMKFSEKKINEIFEYKGSTDIKAIRKFLYAKGFIKNFKIINVVGTNGKGSVSKYIKDILIKRGYRVGSFTSPHIFKYNERIKINNDLITEEEFYELAKPLLKDFEKLKQNFFSLMYIVAMLYFASKELDFVILEAGIGGKKDSTNAIDGEYGVLTSIGEDHLNIFKTRDNIPVDKASIANEGMKFYMPSNLTNKDMALIKETTKSKNAKLIKIPTFSDFYEKRNMKLALGVMEDILSNKTDIKLIPPFGRTTLVKKDDINIIYDVAHNYDGIKESVLSLKKKGITYDKVVLSLSSDKDDSSLDELFEGKEVFIYKHNGPKPKELKDFKVKSKVIEDLKVFKKNNKSSTLYIGSFYLISEVIDV